MLGSNHKKLSNKKLVCKLALFHIAIIALANYTVQFTGAIAGYDFTWGMFVFPLVILATDLTVRLSNQHNARTIVAIAYIPAILISAWLADWRIGIASGTAYLIGQLLDIAVFQKIRERSSLWWTAPLISTLRRQHHRYIYILLGGVPPLGGRVHGE